MLGAGRKYQMRLAIAFGCVAVALTAASASFAAEIVSATYGQPTTRYQHGVLGDDIEYGALEIALSDGSRVTLTLPESRVFEDLEPRLVDVDLDGAPEVVTVESSATQGARLSIYDEMGLVAATPYIGRSNRWLAPISAADLDGDGAVEIAYIDRPHLAKTLRIWRFENGNLNEVISKAGYTNHRIGWDFIVGGLRECDQGPEMIVATGNWSQIVSIKLDGNGSLSEKVVQDYLGPDSFSEALMCP